MTARSCGFDSHPRHQNILDTWTDTDDYEIPDDDGQTFPRSLLHVNKEIYVMFAGGSGQTRLTNTLENDDSPSWSANGSQIVFRSDRERDNADPVPQVWVMNSDGSGQTDLSNNNGGDYSPHYQFASGGGGPSSVLSDGVSSLTFDNSSNRITTGGFNYDVAGNEVRALVAGGGYQRFRYDAANRMVQVLADNNSTVLASYTYGSSNERLVSDEGGYRTYFDCEGGATIAEYSEPDNSSTLMWSKSYVYLGARLLSTLTPNGGGGDAIEFDHPDRLGTRIVTNPTTGNFFEQQTLPFGTALNETPPAGGTFGATNRRFTTYDRSAVTGLDYAYNRHYDSQQGRFTQVDPDGMDATSLANPQTLNLLAYCANDPINRTDPTGLGFFSKLWHAIKKVITSKWFMIAVTVAIILIAHYYPNSIFGALGGGSHAGGVAPLAHGAGATTGLGGAASAGGWTAAELSAAASSAGWVSYSGVAIMYSPIAVSAASSGIATAVSLGLAGGLAAGVVAGQGQVSNDLKQRVEKIGKNCSDYMNSLLKQLGSKYTAETFGDLFDRVGLGRIKIDPNEFIKAGARQAAGLAEDGPRRIFINKGVTAIPRVTTFELLHHARGSGMFDDHDLDKAVIKLMDPAKRKIAEAGMKAKGYERSTIAHRQLNENCFSK